MFSGGLGMVVMVCRLFSFGRFVFSLTLRHLQDIDLSPRDGRVDVLFRKFKST